MTLHRGSRVAIEAITNCARRTFLLGALITVSAAAAEVDPALPEYRASPAPLAGSLNSVGSDTLNNLMTYWAEGFQALHPGSTIQIEGKGGDTAESALIRFARIGPMTQPMSEQAVAAFTQRWGYPPTGIVVALDALAVFVHRDNPVPSLTFTQVDAAFSSTRRRGGTDIATWGDVGLAGDWATRPLVLSGRNSASGTYGFLKRVVLEQGDFKTTVTEHPGSRAAVAAVAAEPGGLGYSGLGYATPGVRAVPLADAQGAVVEPTADNVVAGRYPLQRSLRLYVNRPPGGDALLDAFLAFVLSRQGQEIVAKDGYIPLNAALAAEQRLALE
ncbi:MAG: substrate-binding domain-containing protein [Planctomycetes bacterium]|nr:substrate-binding domain-containing protein [Planctomycetota bacterium]